MAHDQKLFRVSGFAEPASVQDDLVDAVVLVGDVATCRLRLESLAATGLTHIDLAPLPVGGRSIAESAQRVMADLGPAYPAFILSP